MTSILKPLSTALFGGLLLSGCVLDEDNDGYTVDVQVGDVVKGVAEVTVTVSGDGVAEGQSINVTPHMRMVDADDNTTMEHGTPFSINEGELDANGQFKTTAYFLMGSKNMSGEKAGDWSINIEYNDAKETFPITVDMMMSDKKSLTGGDTDQINSEMDMSSGGMEATSNPMPSMTARSYYLFDLGRHVMDGMNSFSVYISARESLFEYTPVAVGETLTGGMNDLGITSVKGEMCAAVDCATNDASWITAMAGDTGEYKAMDLGLAGDENDEVEVRLTVNDTIKKTSDDMDHATFTFSAMNMSGM